MQDVTGRGLFTAGDVLAAIGSGEMDGGLESIVAAVAERKSAKARLVALNLKVGDVVELMGCSPRYVNGMQGTVVETHGRRGKTLVDVPDLMGTRFARRSWFAPEQLRRVP